VPIHPKAVFTEAHIEGVFEANLSSILIRQHGAFFGQSLPGKLELTLALYQKLDPAFMKAFFARW
jgi:hypothetical protein